MKNNKVKNEDKQIIKYASILALVISIIILVVCFIFNLPKTYVLGFIMSFIVNIIGFIKSNSRWYKKYTSDRQSVQWPICYARNAKNTVKNPDILKLFPIKKLVIYNIIIFTCT